MTRIYPMISIGWIGTVIICSEQCREWRDEYMDMILIVEDILYTSILSLIDVWNVVSLRSAFSWKLIPNSIWSLLNTDNDYLFLLMYSRPRVSVASANATGSASYSHHPKASTNLSVEKVLRFLICCGYSGIVISSNAGHQQYY